MNSSRKFCPLLIIVLACVHEGVSIKCWVCKSNYDNSCTDPFDNSTMVILDCNQLPDLSHIPGVKATMCRKIRQRVNGEVKIFRDCAYLGEPDIGKNKKHCVTRTAINKISMEYCTCNDKDGCNTGTTTYSNKLAITFTALLTYFMTCT